MCRLADRFGTLLLTTFSGRRQFGIARLKHFPFTTGKFRRRCHVSQRAVQADFVVMRDEVGHDAPRVLNRQGRAGANAIGFDGAVKSFQLAVGQSCQLHPICAMVSELFR